MAIIRLLPIIMIPAFVISCATPYSRAVNLNRLNDRVAEITSSGNSETSINRIRDYSKLAAAEACLNGGFSHFSELENEMSRQDGAVFVGDILAPYTKFNRATRVYFHKRAEDVPVTAIDCNMIYSSLAPKYISQ